MAFGSSDESLGCRWNEDLNGVSPHREKGESARHPQRKCGGWVCPHLEMRLSLFDEKNLLTGIGELSIHRPVVSRNVINLLSLDTLLLGRVAVGL